MPADHTFHLSSLNTERLVLRYPEITDDIAIAALRSDPEINKHLGRQATTSVDEASNFIRQLLHGIENNQSYYWAITLTNESKLIGTICLWNIDRERGSIELGYELGTNYQGIGLMQEAVVKVIEIAFQHLGYKKLNAFTHPENIKSINLLQKNGFIQHANPEVFTDGKEPDLYFCLINPSAI